MGLYGYCFFKQIMLYIVISVAGPRTLLGGISTPTIIYGRYRQNPNESGAMRRRGGPAMKTANWIIVFVAVAIFIAANLLTFGPALGQAPQSADPIEVAAPIHQVGDWWIVLNTTANRFFRWEIVEITPEERRMTVTNLDDGRTATTWRDRNFNFLRRSDRKWSYKPGIGGLRFPLVPGSWTSEHEEVGGNARHTGTAQTTARWEEVTVRAGNFVAMRVETTRTWTYIDLQFRDHRTYPPITEIQWYVPAVRWSVRWIDGSGTAELVEFGRAGQISRLTK